MGTRVAALTAIVCALALLPGCSWTFVERAPPHHAHRTDFTCTTNQAAPAADTLLAAGFGGVGALGVIDGATCSTGGFECLGARAEVLLGVLFLLPAVLLVASAITGFVATADCDEALAARPREYVAAAPQAPVVPAPPPPPPVPAPRRGANGTLEHTFAMSDVRVDLRAMAGNTERIQVALSRLVAADRVSNTPCDTWSIVAGGNTRSVPGGLYRATREAAGTRETFGNEIPLSALRQFVDGSNQGLAAIDLCRERLYLSMTARNELARFFAELDAMVRERTAAPVPAQTAPIEAAPIPAP